MSERGEALDRLNVAFTEWLMPDKHQRLLILEDDTMWEYTTVHWAEAYRRAWQDYWQGRRRTEPSVTEDVL